MIASAPGERGDEEAPANASSMISLHPRALNGSFVGIHDDPTQVMGGCSRRGGAHAARDAIKPDTIEIVGIRTDTRALGISTQAIIRRGKHRLEDRFIELHVQKELHCNWKGATEAFLENYHTQETHPQLLAGNAAEATQYDILSPRVRRTDYLPPSS